MVGVWMILFNEGWCHSGGERDEVCVGGSLRVEGVADRDEFFSL
jgi:hypothetical protein